MTEQPRHRAPQDFEELSNMLGAFGPCDAIDLHLMALLGTDEEGHEAALDYLDSAVIYEGTPFPVTAAAGLAVVEILSDPRAELVRPELLRFVQMVAECGTQFEADRATLLEMAAVVPVDSVVDQALAEFKSSGDSRVIDALFSEEEVADAILARSILNCVEVAGLLCTAVSQFTQDADTAVKEAAADALEELNLLLEQYA